MVICFLVPLCPPVSNGQEDRKRKYQGHGDQEEETLFPYQQRHIGDTQRSAHNWSVKQDIVDRGGPGSRMIEHYAKVDKGKEDDDKADENAGCSEGLERECHCPASHEPIRENDREPNSMDYCFLKIGTRSQEKFGGLGSGTYFCLFFPKGERLSGKVQGREISSMLTRLPPIVNNSLSEDRTSVASHGSS